MTTGTDSREHQGPTRHPFKNNSSACKGGSYQGAGLDGYMFLRRGSVKHRWAKLQTPVAMCRDCRWRVCHAFSDQHLLFTKLHRCQLETQEVQ